MRVRIVKADNCPKCKAFLDRLDKVNFKYETFNGSAKDKESESLLDSWGINDMPVVQILKDDGTVCYQFAPGSWSPQAITFKMKQLENK